jgi:hypothetical protein
VHLLPNEFEEVSDQFKVGRLTRILTLSKGF